MSCFYEAKTIKLNNDKVPVEPQEPLDISRIRNQHLGKTCPICSGCGRLKCGNCKTGTIPLLGGFQQCSQCLGDYIKACPVCSGFGVIHSR